MSTDHLTENFRPINGWPGYRVSNWGRVQSRWIVGGRRHQTFGEWHDRKIQTNKDGYKCVTLKAGKKPVLIPVHRLVLETFAGPRPPGTQCRHLDGNLLNNRIDNLVWGTSLENHEDRRRHGHGFYGARNPNVRLSEDDVREIRRLLNEGVTGRHIASQYKVHEQTIYNIKSNKTWTHI